MSAVCPNREEGLALDESSKQEVLKSSGGGKGQACSRQEFQQAGALLRSVGITLFGVVRFEDEAARPFRKCRAVQRLPDHAESVICCLFPYYVPRPPDEPRNLSRYACVPDYHQAAGGILQTACGKLAPLYPGHSFEYFLDNSPFYEVPLALRAGLGVLGRNGLLIHPLYGSYIFIGEIVTTLRFDPDDYASPLDSGRTDSLTGFPACLGCGACQRACPGKALSYDGSGPDETKCLSAISQKKGTLSPKEEALLRQNGLVWGCDRCQEVCPMNQEILPTPLVEFSHNYHSFLNFENLSFRLPSSAYGWRGIPVISRNLSIFMENPFEKPRFWDLDIP